MNQLIEEEQKTLQEIYNKLDKEWNDDISNWTQYVFNIENTSDKLKHIIQIEHCILVYNNGKYLESKYKEDKDKLIKYIENRIESTRSNLLKAKYFHAIYLLTQNNKYCQSAIDYYIQHIKNAPSEDSYKKILSKTIDLSNRIKYKKLEIKDILINLLKQKPVSLSIKFKILRLFKETKFIPSNESQTIADLSLELTKNEEIHKRTKEFILELALFFAQRATNNVMVKNIYQELGDLEYSYVKNIEENLEAEIISMTPFQNVHHLINASQYYKLAENKNKEKQALRELSENKKKQVIPKISISIKDTDKLNRSLESILKVLLSLDTSSLINILIKGGKELLLPSIEDIKKNKEDNNYYFTQMLTPTFIDVNSNSRKASKEEFELAIDYDIYLQYHIKVIINIIGEAILQRKITYEILKKHLTNDYCFGIKWDDKHLDKKCTYTWFSLVDIGLKEFFKQMTMFVHSRKCDWRLCIDFLSIKIEPIIREIIVLNGETSTKIVNDKGDTREYLLEDLFHNEKLEALLKSFTEDDIYFFKYVLTKTGLNIRNNVAHGFLKPFNYSVEKAILVFMCVLRLAKYQPELIVKSDSCQEI